MLAITKGEAFTGFFANICAIWFFWFQIVVIIDSFDDFIMKWWVVVTITKTRKTTLGFFADFIATNFIPAIFFWITRNRFLRWGNSWGMIAITKFKMTSFFADFCTKFLAFIPAII